ncbi:MAG: hypothetical protein ACR2PA_22210, partial [Hyphomicrobiaceae bacterium]
MALLVQVVAVAAVAAATAADSPRPVSKYKLAGIAGAQFHAAPRFNATESSVLHVAERPSLGRTDQVFDISTQSTARAIQIWSGISRTRDIQLLQAFHKAFSRTSPLLARLAMERIADLKSDRVALSASVLPRAAARQRQPAVGCRETQVELATGVTTCLTPGNGQSFRDCSFCPDLVVVPSGRFRLRLPRIRSDDGQHDTDVRVMIGSALAVGRFPVTRREFAIFVKATGHSSAYDGCRIWSRDGTRVRVGGSWRSPGFDQSD